MPMEVKLLQMAQGTTGVIEILDYFERSDSYLIVMERPLEVVMMLIIIIFAVSLTFFNTNLVSDGR